ncbi:phage tail protein [Mesorhizobium loti]|nr:phage tail protein [Mesorhizobium loti]
MAQHDMVVDNAPGLSVRTDINAALAALVSSSSGTVEPLTKVAGQLWFNTSSGLLSLRNAANTAWVGVASQLGGSITLTSPLSFTGTSAGVGTGLIAVRDSVVTVGAEGNAVFAINKQNSATHGLMVGNDGNGAALIGNNNAALRFGKWVSGVFTEKMTDTTASAYDFWMHVDAQNWYVLVDRDGNGAYETPHPLTLEADTNKGFLFGSEIMTTAAAIVSPTTQVIAGNGLTGGGALSANVTLNVGTPGNITNSSTNSVGADTHAHALGFTAAEVYAGTGASDTVLPLGHTIFVALGSARYDNNSAQTISLSGTTGYVVGTTTPLAGTWRSRGGFTASGDRFGVFERTA